MLSECLSSQPTVSTQNRFSVSPWLVNVWPKLAMFCESISSSTRPHWVACISGYGGALASPGGAHTDDTVVGADGVRPATNNIILMLLISGYYTDPGSEEDSDFLSLLKDKLPNLVLEGPLSPVKFIWITTIFLPWLLSSQDLQRIEQRIDLLATYIICQLLSYLHYALNVCI